MPGEVDRLAARVARQRARDERAAAKRRKQEFYAAEIKRMEESIPVDWNPATMLTEFVPRVFDGEDVSGQMAAARLRHWASTKRIEEKWDVGQERRVYRRLRS